MRLLMLKKITVLVLLTNALIIAGCANQPSNRPAPVPEKIPEAQPQPQPQAPVIAPQPVPAPKPTVVIPPNPAAGSLAKQARAQYLARDYQSAIASAERGLRIDRRAADLYLVLAQSYLQLALPEKAKMFVQQGLRYAQQGSETAESLLRVQGMVGQHK